MTDEPKYQQPINRLPPHPARRVHELAELLHQIVDPTFEERSRAPTLF
jgi:hypothetical protein